MSHLRPVGGQVPTPVGPDAAPMVADLLAADAIAPDPAAPDPVAPETAAPDSEAADPVVALAAFGGSARWAQLRETVPRPSLARAVATGRVAKHGPVYALPDCDQALIAARRLHGVASHRSAARLHDFALPPGPDTHHVMVPPRAHREHVPDDVQLHWGAVPETDRTRGMTGAVLTVVHVLRDLPLRDAISVGDSALRAGVRKDAIAEAIAGLRGPGSAVARSRFDRLDVRSENAFESSCRAITIAAGLLGFRPQVVVCDGDGFIGRADLGDEVLRIAIECDGAGTHSGAAALLDDCVRHTRLIAAGWLSLRFTWQQVMFRPAWVAQRILDTVARRTPGGGSR